MKRINNNRKTRSTIAVETDWRIVAVVIVCGLALAAGFFFAARQHFLSMDIGFKNSRLRRQLEDLESEKRRLLLAREVSLSPIELKKASRSIVPAVTELKTFAQTVSYKPTRPSTAGTSASLGIRPAATILSRPRPALVPQRAEAAARADAATARKPGIELAAAINLR